MWHDNDHHHSPLRRIAPLLILLALAFVLTWGLSTTEQQQRYLDWLTGTESYAEDDARGPLDIAARAAGHDARPAPSCLAPTRDITEVEEQAIYRWRGAHGEWVFSDQPRPDEPSEDISARYRPSEQFARVQVRGEQSRFPAQIQSVIGNDVQQMSRILRDSLDLPVRQIALDIVMYGDPDRFAVTRGETSGLSGNVRGFYQHGTNRVSILELPGLEATRAVARHEASHAMLAGMYGSTPVWINEGLAEVMSRLEVTGQLRELHPHSAHTRQLSHQFRSGGKGALLRLLQHDHESWRRLPASMSYAHAWSLVYDLLGHSAGRQLIQVVLAAQEAAPCQPIDSVALVESHYPGGVQALESRWLARARSGDWKEALRF